MSKITNGEMLFPEITDPAERRAAVLANAAGNETDNVKRYFKEDELSEMKEEISSISIQRKDKVDAFRKVSKKHKDEVKGLTACIDENLVNVKKGFIEEEQTVYHFADQDSGKMITTDADGVIISSRKLRPNERQTTIVDINRTGTYD